MNVQVVSALEPLRSRAPKRGRLGRAAIAAGIVAAAGLYAAGSLPRLRRERVLAADLDRVGTAVPAVTVVAPRLVSDQGLTLPGTIEAMQTAAINARTTGYLRRLTVDIGSRVKAGQLLAEIAAPDVEQQLYQARAQTAQSQAAVSQAQATVDQAQATVARDQAAVAQQQAAVQQAHAQVESFRAAASQAEASELASEANRMSKQHALDAARATLRQQQAHLDLARANYRRTTALVAQGFLSRQDADTGLTTVKSNAADVNQAQAAVKGAQADVDAAARSVEASKAAVLAARANLAASEENARAAEGALAAAQATVRAAQQAVRANRANMQANQANVSANQANARRYAILHGFDQVVAPFDGVITSRNVEVGALINAGGGGGNNPVTSPTTSTGMLGIARTDAVRVQVSVPQTYVPALRAGGAAQVNVRELPGRTFAGPVTMRAGALDAATRTQLVEVHLPNHDGALVPGMFSEVRLTPAGKPAHLQIPGSALVVDAQGTRVASVSPEGRVHYLNVQVGRDFGTDVEIRGGLQGNERLVDNPPDTLTEGDPVQLATSPAPLRPAAAPAESG